MELTFKFEEEDFDGAKYLDSWNCPITRVLRRLGYPSPVRDSGKGFQTEDFGSWSDGQIELWQGDNQYNLMVQYVIDTLYFETPFKPKEFTITLSSGDEEKLKPFKI